MHGFDTALQLPEDANIQEVITEPLEETQKFEENKKVCTLVS